jgi:ABC-type antimicrobial peptide transport system permease subunit
VDPIVATSSTRTLEEVLSTSLGARRLNVHLLELFGQVAIGLCAVGAYGVASFSAHTRSRELAIRAALGARRRDLTRLLIGTELWPVGIGIGVGLSAAYVASRLLFGTPFETDPRDISTYVAVGAGLLVLCAGASYVPVRRASTTNPAAALQAS